MSKGCEIKNLLHGPYQKRLLSYLRALSVGLARVGKAASCSEERHLSKLVSCGSLNQSAMTGNILMFWMAGPS